MGKYYTAEDVNTDTKDAEYMLRTTDYVVGREDVSGDPSPITAIGVFDGIRAVAAGHGNVQLADFSDREYEKYFLYDIVHFGTVGWADVDRAMYEFAMEG